MLTVGFQFTENGLQRFEPLSIVYVHQSGQLTGVLAIQGVLISENGFVMYMSLEPETVSPY